MAEPEIIGEPQEFWIDYDHKDKNGNPTYSTTPPPDIPGGVFGIGNRPAKVKHIRRYTFANGEIFDFDDDDKSTYVRTDPQLAAKWKAGQKGESAPVPRKDAYGRDVIWDPDAVDPKTGKKGAYVPAPGMPRKMPDVQDPQGKWLTYDPDLYDPDTGQQGKYVPKSPKTGEPKSGFYAPPTTAPKLFNYETGEWEDNRGYVPPREPQVPNPYASDFTKGPTRYRYNAQGIPEPVFTFPEEEERPTPYQQWTMGAKWDYDKEQDRIQREQQQAQQELAQRQAAWRAASDVIGQQQQMAPYALRPGQTHFSSYGPGEAWSNLYPWLGLPYNPDSFKVAPVNIDWEKQFRKTQELMGGK